MPRGSMRRGTPCPMWQGGITGYEEGGATGWYEERSTLPDVARRDHDQEVKSTSPAYITPGKRQTYRL